MNIDMARTLAHKVKHSPKFNKELKFQGITVSKGDAHVVVLEKETGQVRHFGEEKTRDRSST
jgi:hypothetical protein